MLPVNRLICGNITTNLEGLNDPQIDTVDPHPTQIQKEHDKESHQKIAVISGIRTTKTLVYF